MKILFDEKLAKTYDGWFDTTKGKVADALERGLILRSIDPQPGESILDVGCGTGRYLQLFSKTGLKATGVDVSFPMLYVARKKLGKDGRLCLAQAEALPFKTKSFDSVSLTTTLEFVQSPLKALQEAFCVSRGKVVLAVLNRYSLAAFTRRVRGLFRTTIYNSARFYSIRQLKKCLRAVGERREMTWKTVLVLPLICAGRFERLERILSFRKNPFGACFVVVLSAEYIERRDKVGF